MKSNGLKKNAFWFLFGAVPLLVGIGVIMIGASVGGATKARQDEYDSHQKEITGAKPKGVGIGVELSKQKGDLDTKVTALWADNFKQQRDAGLFAWPTTNKRDSDLALLEKLGAPFGDTFEKPTVGDAPATGPTENFLGPDQGAFIDFASPEVYLRAYEGIAKRVHPTRFGAGGPAAPAAGGPGEPGGRDGPGGRGPAGPTGPTGPMGPAGPGLPGGGLQNNAGAGWQAVLRHVTDWGTTSKPTLPEFWLALEDFWVQRELLAIVARTNTALTKFEPEFSFWNYNPLKRTFASRLWALDLEVVTEGNRKYLKATVRNQTDRLQMLGAGKVMRLKVWLDNPNDAEPSLREYVLGGELVAGRDALDVPLLKTDPRDRRREGPHAIPLDRLVTRIAKVEQILDEVNVPVKLVQTIELGVTDHRRAAATFVAPKIKGLPEDAAVDPNAQPGGEVPGGPPGGLPGPGGPGGRDGPGGLPGVPGGGAAGAAKSGPKEAVLLANKLRYIEVTDQVRRMPVAMSLVLDLAFMQDLLVQFTNSPMRFHVSQVNWQRFRGTLPTSTPAPGTGAPGTGVPGVPGTGTPGFPGGPGGGEEGYPGATGGNAAANAAQANAGLVTLSVYGIVAMYNDLPLTELRVADDVKVDGLGTDWKQPKKVASDADLLALVPDEAARAALARAVDFRTHDLLAFGWEGTPTDKLTFTVTDQAVKFGLAPGAKKDDQQPAVNRKLFAIRRAVKWTAD